jgi:hypothetical protein
MILAPCSLQVLFIVFAQIYVPSLFSTVERTECHLLKTKEKGKHYFIKKDFFFFHLVLLMDSSEGVK